MGSPLPNAPAPIISTNAPNTSEPSSDPEKGPEPAASADLHTTDDLLHEKKGFLRKLLNGREPNPLRWRTPPPVPTERVHSPEETAGWLSRGTFSWIGPLMTTGYLRTLTINDLPLINRERSAAKLTLELSTSFNRRVAEGQKNPLLWSLHEVLRTDFYLGGLARILADLLLVMAPFLMKYLISYANRAYSAHMAGQQGPKIAEGIGYVLGITAMQVVSSFCLNQFLYRGMCTGGMARAGLIGMVFEKSLKISGRARAGTGAEGALKPETEEEEETDEKGGNGKKKDKKEKKSMFDEGAGAGWTNGRVVNLMGTDTYRVDQAASWFHLVWTSPVLVIVTLIVLLVNITYSALAGFALLVAAVPLMGMVIKSLTKRRIFMNSLTDQRVGLMQEILLGVKFVKYYAWEKSFLKDLGKVRDSEVRAVQVILGVRGGVNAIGMSLPIFASMLAFITYSTTHHNLDPAPIFSSLALFNVLRLPLNLLPVVVGQVIDAWVSLKRIESFLIAEEITDAIHHDLPAESDHAVVIEGGEFTWEANTADGQSAEEEKKKLKETKRMEAEKMDSALELEEEKEKEPFKLRNIDLSFGKNELTAIVGGVGSGKSSLLAAIAGDMRKTAGKVRLREGDNIGYCPQYAWIQNATVKDNIVFAKPFDQEWYNTVITACALPRDFSILPNGDQTEIGERGITISGGQKARINIARAIYFDADIVLMDDPLSAVDAHVGRHLFDEAITGLLKDKCVILATHQLHVLRRCGRVVWMENGKVRDQGSFDELMARNPEFVEMMSSTAAEAEADEQANKEATSVDDSDEDAEMQEIRKEQSRKSIKEAGQKNAGLMQAEEKGNASVPWSVYKAYIQASGSLWVAPLLILLLMISQVTNIWTTLWLGYWTSDKYGLSQGQYIGVFAGLGAAQSLLFFAFAYSLTIAGTRSSKKLMNKAMEKVLKAPMSFFDTTPMGRIVNRFSKDVDVLDNTVTDAMRMYFMTLAMILSVFILIIVFFPWFAIALVPLAAFFFFAAGYYRASAREVKRHEAVLRSTVFAKFGEGLSGTACIRAYGLQKRFTEDLIESIDQMDSAYFLTFANQRWLSLRLDCIGNSLVFTVGILVCTSRLAVSPSISGVVFSYILQIVGMIQWMIRQLAEVENAMNAAERLHYYGNSLPSEAEYESSNPPPASWPERGEIKFENVSMRYRPGLPLVLKNFSLDIKAGERIAVVGRTGAGKSTIMTTLFRLVDPLAGGRILIDGIDIASIGLHELRRKLAIIPQDPTLFRGTIRSNLDPFGEKTDAELWAALRQSNLVTDTPSIPPLITKESQINSSTSIASSQPAALNLDTVTEEEGSNFSLGQRQLLALARALVRDARIIIADEATSSVDLETDAKIQQTMRDGFKGRTMLTIAHRLRTITRYDRVVVLGAGEILEEGKPGDLWRRKGEFWGMCERGGVGEADFDFE